MRKYLFAIWIKMCRADETGAKDDLVDMARYGVTTGLDMATWPVEKLDSLRGHMGMTDIRSAGIPASAPGGSISRLVPEDAIITDTEKAIKFVADRIKDGSDYIKIVADIPGSSQEILNTITQEAHKHGKMVVTHAATYEPYIMAVESKSDSITHIPMDEILDSMTIQRMKQEGQFAIPTLTMMETMHSLKFKHCRPENARDSVTLLYKAGIPVLAGTDSHRKGTHPFEIQHGMSLHHELELLVAAGMSNVDVLRSATILPAKYFGLSDRGIIQPGKRADLVLIESNPLEDIRATQNIRRVWCAGFECRQT
ncbi:unnamed protein product [Umbelopsis ramanniana]